MLKASLAGAVKRPLRILLQINEHPMDEQRIGAVSTCNKTQIYRYCFFNQEFNAHP